MYRQIGLYTNYHSFDRNHSHNHSHNRNHRLVLHLKDHKGQVGHQRLSKYLLSHSMPLIDQLSHRTYKRYFLSIHLLILYGHLIELQYSNHRCQLRHYLMPE